MKNSELIDKLNQAQALLADVYHWADRTNDEIAGLMSTADGCICEALDILESNV